MVAQADVIDIIDRHYEGETVEIDGYRFKRCTFARCEMIYRGEGLISFDGCIFTDCRWTLDGPAENVMVFLEDLYTGLGDEGEEMVEALFAAVRNGGVRDQGRPRLSRTDWTDARRPVGV